MMMVVGWLIRWLEVMWILPDPVQILANGFSVVYWSAGSATPSIINKVGNN